MHCASADSVCCEDRKKSGPLQLTQLTAFDSFQVVMMTKCVPNASMSSQQDNADVQVRLGVHVSIHVDVRV